MHRKIELVLPQALTGKEQAAVSDLGRHFEAGDMQLHASQASVSIMLRAIDMKQLRKVAGALTQGNAGSAEVLDKIVQKIDAVKSYGLQGKKRLFVGYDSERKVTDRTGKEKKRGKLYYAADFPAQSNPVPDQYRDALICGDALDVLRELPDNCADLIFTSPPYNFGLCYQDDQEDDNDWQAYFDSLYAVFDESIRVLRRGGRIVVNVQPLYSDYIPSHHLISNFFVSRGLIWRGEILWEKNNYNCKYTAWGSWKSPSNPYMKYSWEFLEVFCKGDLKKEGRASNADITADEFKKWVYGKWSIAPARGDKFDHPAMFPEELAHRVLKLFSFRGDFVIDPFSGIGTTAAVAKQCGRSYLGIDISKKYTNSAKKRLASILL